MKNATTQPAKGISNKPGRGEERARNSERYYFNGTNRRKY
jgi:hypothetical protein